MVARDKAVLRDKTKEYWDRHMSNEEWYVNHLLVDELDYAETHHRLPDNPPHGVETVVLMVGYRFEPLLQTVCVYKPQRLILLVNGYYGTANNRIRGELHGKNLRELIQSLHHIESLGMWRPPAYQDEDIQLCVIAEDSPTEVFRTLLEVFTLSTESLHERERQANGIPINIIDITGAKKSMVVGGFLYAAHSEMPISYVDFGDYEPQRGRPYGYTCKIGQIANPYAAFHLRDWERVRQLYRQGNFREAHQLIVGGQGGLGIIGVMESHLDSYQSGGKALYDEESIAKVKQLCYLLELYEAWDNGDYRGASDLATDLPSVALPQSVTVLGSLWPTTSDDASALLKAHLALKKGDSSAAKSLFHDPAALLSYLRDEYAKIGRLIALKEDYRSGFLRAVGLHEFLLKSRLALLWIHDRLEVALDDASYFSTCSALPEEADKQKVFAGLVSSATLDVMWKLLSRASPCEKLGNHRFRRPQANLLMDGLKQAWEHNTLNPFSSISDGTPTLHRLRNEAIHTSLSIPQPLAQAAYELVGASLEDFEQSWYPLTGQSPPSAEAHEFQSLPWNQLCEVCALDFLPPKLRTA